MLYLGVCVRSQEELPHCLPYFVAKLRYFGMPVVFIEFPVRGHDKNLSSVWRFPSFLEIKSIFCRLFSLKNFHLVSNIEH